MNILGYEYEGGRSEEHMHDLVEAFERNDGAYFDSEALEDLATHYFEIGDLEQALVVVDEQIDKQPYSSDAWMRRGILLNHLALHESALEAYGMALSINPVDPETIVYRGATLESMGREEEAVACYREALELDPLHFDAHFSIGAALQKEDRLEEAIEILEFCVEQRPEHPEVYYELGYCYDRLGDAP